MIHDLTQPLSAEIPRYPGDPAVRIVPHPMEPPWRVSALHLGSHSGTHIDAPRHFFAAGPGIGAYPVDRFVRVGIVLDASGRDENEPLGPEILEPVRDLLAPGRCAVLRTGWDLAWGDARYFRHPFVGAALATALVATGVDVVAIDALSVDSTVDGGAAAHERFFGGDILIVENLRGLAQLAAGTPYVFAFLPLALGDVDGAPVRALAWDLGHQFVASHADG